MATILWQPIPGSKIAKSHTSSSHGIFPSRQPPDPGTFHPESDVFETDSRVTVRIDLPGVRKEDITIMTENNRIVLRGKRTAPEVSAGAYFHRERFFGSFFRTFALPEAIRSESIRAAFHSGVLEISIPKPEKPRPRPIEIG